MVPDGKACEKNTEPTTGEIKGYQSIEINK
jgi:hypothetical protein